VKTPTPKASIIATRRRRKISTFGGEAAGDASGLPQILDVVMSRERLQVMGVLTPSVSRERPQTMGVLVPFVLAHGDGQKGAPVGIGHAVALTVTVPNTLTNGGLVVAAPAPPRLALAWNTV
jgi:hypothetical protein